MAVVEAVIVAGGPGTRMMPLTAHRPKHLLPVGGVPFVAHQLAKLAGSGVDRVILATSHHAAQFEPVLGDGSAWGLELMYVRESEPLGTAGAIRNVAGLLHSTPDEPVVVLNGDVLSGHDLRAQLDRHRRTGADVTLHLVEVDDARAFGCVPTDDEGRVSAFLEKMEVPVSRQINAGCYVFARRIIDQIPVGRAVSVEHETFPALLAAGFLVQSFIDAAYWIDVGTPQRLLRASVDLVTGAAVSPAAVRDPAPAWVAGDTDIADDVELSGGTTVGTGSRIEAGAVVRRSVVDADCVIGARSVVEGCVLGVGVTVAPGRVVVGHVFADGHHVDLSMTPP